MSSELEFDWSPKAQLLVFVGNIRVCRICKCLFVSRTRYKEQHSTRSALVSVVVVVTESLDTTANGIAQTESSEQPVVRVTTVVVHGAIVAAVVVASLSGVTDVLPRVRVGAGKTAEGRAGRHLDGTGGSLSHSGEVDQSSAGGNIARSRRFRTRGVFLVCVD